MDIYSYMNSRDIAEHCRSLNHQFNAMEAAFIVYWNHSITLLELHDAYREIIASMPDVEIAQRNNFPYHDSLHRFLEAYMDVEDRILDEFQADADHAVYRFGVYYPNGIGGGLRYRWRAKRRP